MQTLFQLVADAMTTQHPRLHEYEKKSFVSGGRKAWQDSPRTPSGKRTPKFMTKAFMAHADCSDESCCEQSDGESDVDDDEENLTGYYCQSSGADEEFEAFLLELLSDFQITIPEIGTFTAKVPPIVVLTSNRTRELNDALKRRCLYLWVDYPSPEKEKEITSQWQKCKG